ncbi:MAG: ImmA/IrrE family metallo-endopeptidase [Synergistes sp.]|nr:ImmA/IrrE family metallo-endopeptidase [Synergistes sp.]
MPPEIIPQWATDEAEEWQRLDDFDILVKAEEITGLSLEIKYLPLPTKTWGIHIVDRRIGRERGRVVINSLLPDFWRRFCLFHEVYHLIYNKKGEDFWKSTFFSGTANENRADSFAWAAAWPDWEESREYGW